MDGTTWAELEGRRGPVAYLGLGTYAGNYGRGGRRGETGYLEAKELEKGDEGELRVLLRREKPTPPGEGRQCCARRQEEFVGVLLTTTGWSRSAVASTASRSTKRRRRSRMTTASVSSSPMMTRGYRRG